MLGRLSCCLVAWLLLSGSQASAADQQASQSRPNVLFIAIDDLRDWVHYLGTNAQVQTPHLDRLAARGVSFTRSYCAAPVCNPSRTALLTGLRPWTSGVYDNGTEWRDAVPVSATTLPALFLSQGYYVAGAGKVFHGNRIRPDEWSDFAKEKKGDPEPDAKQSDGVGGIKFAPLDCRDEDMTDYNSVSYAIDQLNRQHDRPLFLACGLHKPHMPWNVPQKYFDLYPLDQIELPKVLETDLDDVPPAGVKMARPDRDHAQMLASGRWKEAVQGYLAAISFADAMIGRLLDGLDKSPYASNTIIVLWGDHGWHLGEKQHWRKFALWEEATRAPLIFVVPGVTRPGGVCVRTVDFMSIYPTLTDLCGLPTPSHVEGRSIRRLLADPAATWGQPAITTHGYKNHAVRTQGWRYIRYADGSEELYDEAQDPREWVNLAGKSEWATVKSDLAHWLPTSNAPPAGKHDKMSAPGPTKKAARQAAKQAKAAE